MSRVLGISRRPLDNSDAAAASDSNSASGGLPLSLPDNSSLVEAGRGFSGSGFHPTPRPTPPLPPRPGLRPHGRLSAAAAARARHPELGAPVCRELAGGAVRARAGHQRLRRAAGEPVARLQAATRAAIAFAGPPGAIRRPCPLRSLRRPWRAIWRARCTCWPATRRTVWRPPWRGSGARSWPATREFPRSAPDAEKHSPELNPTCNSRLRPADRRKEDALNKRRRGKPVLRDAR